MGEATWSWCWAFPALSVGLMDSRTRSSCRAVALVQWESSMWLLSQDPLSQGLVADYKCQATE